MKNIHVFLFFVVVKKKQKPFLSYVPKQAVALVRIIATDKALFFIRKMLISFLFLHESQTVFLKADAMMLQLSVLLTILCYY